MSIPYAISCIHPYSAKIVKLLNVAFRYVFSSHLPCMPKCRKYNNLIFLPAQPSGSGSFKSQTLRPLLDGKYVLLYIISGRYFSKDKGLVSESGLNKIGIRSNTTFPLPKAVSIRFETPSGKNKQNH